MYFLFKFRFKKCQLVKKVVIHSYNFIEAVFPSMTGMTNRDEDSDTEVALHVRDGKYGETVIRMVKTRVQIRCRCTNCNFEASSLQSRYELLVLH